MFYPRRFTASIEALASARREGTIRGVVKQRRERGGSGPRVRRRHRTWIRSMILATGGWGAFWCSALWARLAEGWAPSPELAYWISTPLALAGFALALITIRGQRSWLLFVSVPLLANGFLVILPWLLPDAGGLHGR